MKKLHLTLLFSLAVFAASSQKVYFFYIQTESSQPFYVKLDKKIQYSSPNGYIILAKLYDSSYTISIGFPQNKWPEQNFALTVNKKDHGYLLKSIPDKGWGLFDLQSMDLLMANNDNDQKKPENGAVTPFTELLSKAADDPSLKEKTVQAKPEEKKPDEVVAIEEPVKTETLPSQSGTSVAENEKSSRKAKRKARKDNEADKEVKSEQPAVVENPKPVTKEEDKPAVKEEIKPVETESENYKKSQVKRYAENSTTEGFGLVFVDQYANGNKDTIRLVIPNPKPVITTVPETPKEEKKFLDISTEPANKPVTEQPKEEKNPDEIVAVPVEEKKLKTNYPNGCLEAASETDLSKLSRKMKTVNDTEEKMIAEAKKYFKSTCFSTEQVKELGALFFNDEARYNFYDLAYKYVIDTERFADLQSELKDPYYLSRFKAMLRN